MCSLFGWLDYEGVMPHRMLRKLTQALANAAKERGTDAAGISYINESKVVIYKRPKPAHKAKTKPYTFYMVIWSNIRRYQYLNSLSDEALAKTMELTTRTLYNYDHDPSALTLKRVQLFIEHSELDIEALISA